MAIMCHGEIDLGGFKSDHGIAFRDYFPEVESGLARMSEDGLVVLDGRSLRVTPRGRFLIRNIAMLFDRYRMADSETRFSRTV